MPKEQRTELGEVHPKFWERTVKEAFKNDPLRIIIEIIKNSADSYTRLHKKGKIKPPFEIFVKIKCSRKRPPTIEVLDHAQGMNSEKLREALKYGTQTSMGEDTEAVTSAEKGVGLKDAMMALSDNWLITIKDGLINERNKHPDFKTGIGREDENITNLERDKLEIPENGTLVIGKLPSYFHERKFSTIVKNLQKHFLLRKLLQIPDYKIYTIDGWKKEKRLLTYKPPKTEKQIMGESFKINYNGEDYPIHLKINKSEKELQQLKPYGEAGLLFFYGKYSVLDFTFLRFDRDLSFSRFFGEARMEIEQIIKNPEEGVIVDEKRRGLDPEHPFNRKLIDEINKRLVTIQEEKEDSKYSFDERTKKEIIKEINKIYKDIKGRGPPPEFPIKPEIFEFHKPYEDNIKEYEQKTIFLIVNSSIVQKELEIDIQSTNPDIIIKGNKKIKIKKEEIKEEFIKKQIPIYSEKSKSKGDVIATSKNPEHSTKIGINIQENPIFSPKDGFEFVPDRTTIVDGGEKKIHLYVDKDIIGGSKEITFATHDPIRCEGKKILPKTPEKLKERLIRNIIPIEISIEVKGTEHIGETATIKASYEDKESELQITIVPEPTITGALRDIIYSPKETKKISDFVQNEGVIEIYYKHPLIKKYMKKKNFKNRKDFLILITDVIAREAVRAFVLSGIKENSSRFEIFDIDHPDPEIEDHITREYYEQSPKMHEIFIKLAKNFKIG